MDELKTLALSVKDSVLRHMLTCTKPIKNPLTNWTIEWFTHLEMPKIETIEEVTEYDKDLKRALHSREKHHINQYWLHNTTLINIDGNPDNQNQVRWKWGRSLTPWPIGVITSIQE